MKDKKIKVKNTNMFFNGQTGIITKDISFWYGNIYIIKLDKKFYGTDKVVLHENFLEILD